MYSWTALYEQFDFKDKKCLITVTSIEVQEKKDSLQAIRPRVQMMTLQSWPFNDKNTAVQSCKSGYVTSIAA